MVRHGMDSLCWGLGKGVRALAQVGESLGVFLKVLALFAVPGWHDLMCSERVERVRARPCDELPIPGDHIADDGMIEWQPELDFSEVIHVGDSLCCSSITINQSTNITIRD